MPELVKPVRVAIIWDFDLTMSEEYQQMPLVRHNFERLKTKHNMETPDDYFKEWDKRRKCGFADGLNYMGQMLDDFRDGCIKDLSADALRNFGAQIRLSPGMPEYLQRVKERWAHKGVNVHHFIVTAGIKPIVEGSPVSIFVDDIYAGAYAERDGKPFEIMSVPQAFQKIEALIQIAKGDRLKRDIKMPYGQYAFSYRNMVILGDGFSDRPPMGYGRGHGATCVCVYKADDWTEYERAKGMIDWAEWILQRDYSPGSSTENNMDTIIRRIVERTCDFPPKLLQDYRNNRITHQPTLKHVEMHLAGCNECTGYIPMNHVQPIPRMK